MVETRLFVLSDLHLGGVGATMFSKPERLADWIHGLPARLRTGERLELVIAGDVVDFLAVSPDQAFTGDPAAATARLESVMRGPHAPVFEALGWLCARGHGLTILVGNHDVELALPAVQAALRAELGAAGGHLRFVDDGRVCQVGGALIEHGNRYDGANANDWTGIRALASQQSRGEEGGIDVEVSAGSELVARVVNPIKARYPFVDLFEPQGPATALLLLAFEPSLLRDLRHVGHLLQAGAARVALTPWGRAWRTRNVGAALGSRTGLDPRIEEELQPELADGLAALSPSDRPVGVSDWLALFRVARSDSLSMMIGEGRSIPANRLRRVQAALRAMQEAQGVALGVDGPGGALGEAAAAMLGRLVCGHAVQTVVMGHTHQARHHGPADRATYINTGTWIDTVSVPDDVLDPGAEGLERLDAWLRDLMSDRRRQFVPSWAEIRIAADGGVREARLCQERPA